MNDAHDVDRRIIHNERRQILQRLEDWLEIPMLILGLAWLGLLVAELTGNLSPVLEAALNVIWVIFILEFLLAFTLAPEKWHYVKRNWLTLIALALPALRVFRIFRALRVLRITRAARAARSLRLVRIFTSVNRGMRALGQTMQRRGFGYIVALTVLVTLAGAAGMHAFEKDAAGAEALDSYGGALWWTAMIMTTLGSDYWPQTGEGRVLCLALSLYALAILGYVTATLASFFLGRDAADASADLAGTAQIEALRREIELLRRQLGGLSDAAEPVAE
jgi:voltage-gated potassium channel